MTQSTSSTTEPAPLKGLKKQLNLFYLALGIFSRIPMPNATVYSASMLNQSNRYFSLVGWLIGVLVAAVGFALSFLVTVEVAVLLAMAFSLLLTGAFHEDGLADTADGIGGGLTLEKKLAIMKDSRIGTYGAVTLFIALFTKYELLVSLNSHNLISHHFVFNDATSGYGMWLALLAAQPISRAVAGSLIFDMAYAEAKQTESAAIVSKSKPLAHQQSSLELAILVIVGALALCFFTWPVIIAVVLGLVLFRFCFKTWLKHHLGGFTGDCLGAAQQLSELFFYLLLLALSNWQIS